MRASRKCKESKNNFGGTKLFCCLDLINTSGSLESTDLLVNFLLIYISDIYSTLSGLHFTMNIKEMGLVSLVLISVYGVSHQFT